MSDKFIVQKARDYAIPAHAATNHLYGDMPYDVHLQAVALFAIKYKNLLPIEQQDNAIAACWTHDVIEDARQTYNDVLKATNKTVADITYALTNEKGRNRAERANDKYYEGIRACGQDAVFVKICDRLANVAYAVNDGYRMAEIYRLEYYEFYRQFERYPQFYPMFEWMKNKLSINSTHAQP